MQAILEKVYTSNILPKLYQKSRVELKHKLNKSFQSLTFPMYPVHYTTKALARHKDKHN